MVPPEARLPQLRDLVDDDSYFMIHAPRQTGKTTLLRSIASSFTQEGEVAALHVSCEMVAAAGDDFVEAQRAILQEIKLRANMSLPGKFQPPKDWLDDDIPITMMMRTALTQWSLHCSIPIVLFLDELDALKGKALEAILAQIRAGHPDRPDGFPASIVLCGPYEVREYQVGDDTTGPQTLVPRIFNINVASLRLGDFTERQLRLLYGLHTDETGQQFTEGALERVWNLTRGQPMLVNVLARECVERIGVRPTDTIGAKHVEAAKEQLIRYRHAHVDLALARLMKTRWASQPQQQRRQTRPIRRSG